MFHSNTPTHAQENPTNKWVVLVIVTFGFFMILLDTTVINVALQTLHVEFNSSLNETQWIISVYVLAMGIIMPLSGFLSRRFGTKRVYLAGLGIFAAGSLLCGLAPNLSLLIVFRIIQGLGGGITSPLGIALLLQSFPVKEHGAALGYHGIAALVAPALGPILGGWLVGMDLWRVIFFLNPPIALISMLLSLRYLHKDVHSGPKKLDLAGIITEVIGFGSILFGATMAANLGWLAKETIFWFALGILSLGAFVFIELRVAKEPILDLYLFKNRIFLNASLLGYVSVLALFGAEFLLPVYLQSLRGISPFNTGMILLPMAVTSGILTILSGKIYDRIGPRMLMITGFAILTLNTWQLSLLKADTSLTWIMVLLAFRGVALGLTAQTTMATSMSVIQPHDLPRGTSLSNATRQVAQSIAVAILATVLISTLSPQVKIYQSMLNAQASTSSNKGAVRGLCMLTPDLDATTGSAVTTGLTQDLHLSQQACEENMAGFDLTYKLTFYASLVALILGAFLPGWPFKWKGRHAMGEYI
jgi:DHA2 family multidrug resistance protein